MKISHSIYPHHSVSSLKESRLLNFAGGNDGKGGASQDGDPDELDPNTPAGKKFKELREANKAKEDELRAEREARIRAEAKAEAFEDFKNSFGADAARRKTDNKQDIKPSNDDTDDIQVNPEDEKYVGKILQTQLARMGLDKVPEVVEALAKNTQSIQATTALDRAKQELTDEFKGTVPFDYNKALQFAKDNGYGMVASTVKDALRMAHKEMNEQAFIEYYRKGDEPQKKAPKMAHSDRGNDGIVISDDGDDIEQNDIEVETFSDARELARKAWAGEEV